VNFTWFQFGATNVDLGWVLDPLSAVMLVMVTFVGPADLYLLDRLHGARRELHALLLLSQLVCGSHAGRGDCE
jgi:formate hydrogenlyase subunit 3/multisubunit Na+/H+ antiporter MnhD subunit